MATLISTGPFATAGEQQAADLLRRLPDGWIIIANKTVVASNDRSFEVDFIVIGDNWVYVMDEKSWWGKIAGNKQNWVLSSGEVRANPLNKADMIGKILADELKAGVQDLKGAPRFCRAAVLLSLSDQSPDLDDPRAVDGVFIKNTILKRLPEVDGKGGSPIIGQHRTEIERILTGLADRAITPIQIGAYQIAETLPGRPGCRIFRATIEEEERVLMVYDLGKDPIAATELHSFYLREFNALSQLRATGIVPQVYDPFPWSDDFLVLPIASVHGQPLRAYLSPETPESFINELLLAAAGFKALAEIQKRKIIHRAIGPDNVYVVSGGADPKIMFGSFYAARTDAKSIAPSLDALAIEDPYAAPELAAGYGYASPSSDCYSLALVFLERFARTLVTDLVAVPNHQIAFPELPVIWGALPSAVVDDLAKLLRSLVDRQLDAAQAAVALTDLAQRLRGEGQTGQGRLFDKRYRVIRMLGQGSTARTYLARDEDFGGVFALKQYLWPSAVRAHAGNEFDVLRRISSPHLPRIYDVFPPQNDVHVKMDYIQGPTLQDVGREFPWPLERWWDFVQDMLSAVQVLEEHHLLHRDIKPANIILREDDGRPVLIDFGFAVRLGIETQVAGAPLYLPPEALTSIEPPPSTDRYALATVFFQVLTGRLPLEQSAEGAGTPLPASTFMDTKIQRLADLLLRAVSPDPTKRPANIGEFRTLLQNAIVAEPGPGGPSLVNPWVDQLRSLYRNSGVGNSNNRGLDTPFVRKTYVPTALDAKLLPQLLVRLPKAIFLSGNPGDGKTAFLEKVRGELERQGAQLISEDESGWEWRYKGHTIRSCYDASEAWGLQSADEQLTARLDGLEGNDEPLGTLTVLVAINDGRLADFFNRHQKQFGWLAEQIDAAQSYDDVLASDVWVVDLKRRAFVGPAPTGAPSLFGKILQTLVAPEAWSMCEGCAAQALCPMRNNALALAKQLVSERLENLFLLSHLRRQRHITVRDLRSALAYLITANTSCAQVHAARHGEGSGISLVDRHYWQSAFAPIETGDEILADLTTLDPARFPHPRLDRFLYFHRSTVDLGTRAILFHDGHDLSPQQFADEKRWIAASKRQLYFEASESGPYLDDIAPLSGQSFPASLLPFQYASAFVDALMGRANLASLRQSIAVGILRSDGVIGLETSRQLSVAVTTSQQHKLTVLKQFPLDDFRLKVIEPRSKGLIETIPDLLLLEHYTGTPRLEITLELFELLMRMAEGLQPSAPEFQPLLEDLVPFKSALLLKETRNLVLVENQRRLHYVTQREGKIARVPSVTEATS